MRINIHAGHNPDGMTACGAVGLIRESTEARAVKDKVIEKLVSMGHTVHDCTCNNGASQQDVLKRIVAACNAHEVDLDVSIHFNA
ncbi:N-acetylmuramoyl-L-alanine amidase, partial [Eisenbergiella tayi]